MERSELEALVAVYERGFRAIEEIFEDDDLTADDKVDAIGDVVFDDDGQDDEAGE